MEIWETRVQAKEAELHEDPESGMKAVGKRKSEKP